MGLAVVQDSHTIHNKQKSETILQRPESWSPSNVPLDRHPDRVTRIKQEIKIWFCSMTWSSDLCICVHSVSVLDLAILDTLIWGWQAYVLNVYAAYIGKHTKCNFNRKCSRARSGFVLHYSLSTYKWLGFKSDPCLLTLSVDSQRGEYETHDQYWSCCLPWRSQVLIVGPCSNLWMLKPPESKSAESPKATRIRCNIHMRLSAWTVLCLSPFKHHWQAGYSGHVSTKPWPQHWGFDSEVLCIRMEYACKVNSWAH